MSGLKIIGGGVAFVIALVALVLFVDYLQGQVNAVVGDARAQQADAPLPKNVRRWRFQYDDGLECVLVIYNAPTVSCNWPPPK